MITALAVHGAAAARLGTSLAVSRTDADNAPLQPDLLAQSELFDGPATPEQLAQLQQMPELTDACKRNPHCKITRVNYRLEAQSKRIIENKNSINDQQGRIDALEAALDAQDTNLKTLLDAQQVELDDRIPYYPAYKDLMGTSWSLLETRNGWGGFAWYKKGISFNEDMTFTIPGGQTGNVSFRSRQGNGVNRR